MNPDPPPEGHSHSFHKVSGSMISGPCWFRRLALTIFLLCFLSNLLKSWQHPQTPWSTLCQISAQPPTSAPHRGIPSLLFISRLTCLGSFLPFFFPHPKPGFDWIPKFPCVSHAQLPPGFVRGSALFGSFPPGDYKLFWENCALRFFPHLYHKDLVVPK